MIRRESYLKDLGEGFKGRKPTVSLKKRENILKMPLVFILFSPLPAYFCNPVTGMHSSASPTWWKVPGVSVSFWVPGLDCSAYVIDGYNS